MSHLCFSHLRSQFFVEPDFTKIDITGAQMVLVMKLSAFGWNIYDGKQPKESLSDYNKSRVIKKHPNILPYLGYVFFFASVLTGPAFDYADYDKFIHATLFDDVPDSKRPGGRRGHVKRRIPRSGLPAFKKFAEGIFWAVLLVVSGNYITLDFVFKPEFVNEKSIFYRIGYLLLLAVTYRLKYYLIWQIAEGSCILCGIGYNGYNPETDSFSWNRVQNIDPYAFETGQNMHAILEAWNMNTNKWLKNYVYARVARKGKKPGFKSTLFTFITSAFWHGTRPGYYLAFLCGAFLQTLGKVYRRNFRPMFLNSDGSEKPTKKYYNILGYITTELAASFMVQPFVILDFKKSIYCWSTVNYYIIYVIVVTLFAFKGPYAKKVISWCKKYHAQPIERVVIKPESSSKKILLNPEETQKIINVYSSRVENIESTDNIPTLGLPPIDVLESIDRADFDQDVKELGEAWTSFRSRRKSLTDDDFEGLKDAYNNFKDEINVIFQGEVNDKVEEVKQKLSKVSKQE